MFSIIEHAKAFNNFHLINFSWFILCIYHIKLERKLSMKSGNDLVKLSFKFIRCPKQSYTLNQPHKDIYISHYMAAHTYLYNAFLIVWVVRGSIDIMVVLGMSTSWMPMLVRGGSIPSFDIMRVGCQVTADWRWFRKFPHHYTWQVEISPVLSRIDNKTTIKKKIMIVSLCQL